MLLGWRDLVQGPFEVQRRDGPALIVVNLMDDLTYRVRSNMGTSSDDELAVVVDRLRWDRRRDPSIAPGWLETG